MKKINKIIILAMLISLSLTNLQSNDNTNPNILFFNGIGSTLNGESTTELSLQSQIDILNSRNYGDSIVVAHSQGGVRALGYAHQNSDTVKGVITIGSPVKGYSPLLVGKEVIKSRIDKVYNDLTCGLLALLVPMYPYNLQEQFGFIPDADDILKDFGIYDKAPLVGEIISGEVFSKSGASDLSPYSKFMKDNINPDRKLKFEKKLVRVPTGKKITITFKKVGFIKIPIPKITLTYKSVYITLPSGIELTKKINDNIPIGFIVGEQNDPLELLDEDSKNDAKEDGINMGKLFGYGEVLHRACAVATSPLFFTSIPGGYWKNAEYCKSAKRLVSNPSNILSDIYGVKDHDLFIPVSDQSRNLKSLGGKSIDEKGYYIKNVTTANHLTELSHDEIWGGDDYKLSNGKFAKYSILGTWIINSDAYTDDDNLDYISGTVVK